MSEVNAILQSRRACLIAPAGCGKTQLIVNATARQQNGRNLILTHTHAGVDALRRRMKLQKVSSSNYHVDTIAGWALRYATAFPENSNLATFTPTGGDWDQVYEAASRVISIPAVKEIVRCSYSGVYVDEYQDCIVQQHQLILKLAEILPCRLVGDPLQGIFDFGRNKPIQWERDVVGSFEVLPALGKYWRWEKTNPQLGNWLMFVRRKLLANEPINLRSAPVEWRKISKRPSTDIYSVPLKVARAGGSVVAIHAWPSQCHKAASCLKGVYSCIEPIDCDDLLSAAETISDSQGIARAKAVLEFAIRCMTAVSTELRSARQALTQGRCPSSTRCRYPEQVKALVAITEATSLVPVLEALHLLPKIPGVKLYRRELFREMSRAIREFCTGEYTSISDAVWHVRNQTRQIGRKYGRCTMGRTVLVKGLEFDHAVVFDADHLDKKNFYVAITRGSKSLTIFSRSPIVNPRSDE